jgi:hypothetical protein
MRNLLILRTAIRPTAYLNTNSPIVRGERRIDQYSAGLAQIFDTVCNLPADMDVALIDNTIGKATKLPNKIKSLLPRSTYILLSNTNSLGRFNKGAGDIQIWRKYKNFLQKYDLIFHFEPRLFVTNVSSISKFFSYRTEHVELSGQKQVKTGHFVLSSENLLNFAFGVNLPKMLLTRASIEDLLFNYLSQKRFNISDVSSWVLRFDPSKHSWESY